MFDVDKKRSKTRMPFEPHSVFLEHFRHGGVYERKAYWRSSGGKEEILSIGVRR